MINWFFNVSIFFRYCWNFACLLFNACWIHVQSLKIIDRPESEKLIIEKKRLNTEFPMLRLNWSTFSMTVNKYFIPIASNFFLRLEAFSHFFSQHLYAIDHPVPVIKNYNDRYMAFSHKYTWILWQNYTLWYRKRWRIWICVFAIIIDGVFREF